MQFQELITFVNKSESQPTHAALNNFFKKDIVADALYLNSNDWVSSGKAAQATEIAEKLISNKGYAIFYWNKGENPHLLWLARDAFIEIDNLKKFGEIVSTLDPIPAIPPNPLLVIKSVAQHMETLKGVEVTSKMLDEDLSDYTLNETWFDEDADWGYSNWSQLFDTWGYSNNKDEPTAWLIQIDNLFAIMNWTQTAVNVLLSYINTKV